MSVSGEFSVFSRFVVKFVEIIAAGLATAVSGYVIAHLTGALSSPVPLPARAVIEDMPNPIPPAPLPSSIFGDRDDQHAAQKQEVTVSPAPQPAPPVNATKIAPPHKHPETATTAADSLAARVRAALATIDANRTRSSRLRFRLDRPLYHRPPLRLKKRLAFFLVLSRCCATTRSQAARTPRARPCRWDSRKQLLVTDGKAVSLVHL